MNPQIRLLFGGGHMVMGVGCPRPKAHAVAGLGIALLLIVFTRGSMFEIEHHVRRRRVPIEANRVVRFG